MSVSKLIELISETIPVLSIDVGRQCAYMLSESGSRIEAGTHEFTEHLKTHSKISVDLVSDWELEWYSMKRDHKGMWWAKSSGVRGKLPVGTDEQITYDTLCAVEKDFAQLREKNSKQQVSGS